MANILKQVITYNDAGLALLQNSFPLIAKLNKEFKDFNTKIVGNKGQSVDIAVPARMTAAKNTGLVISDQDTEQRFETLVVDQDASVAYTFNSTEFIFNVHDWMKYYGKSAIATLGATIETDLATEIVRGTNRFFSAGFSAGVITDITGYGQLADGLSLFREIGDAGKNQAIIPNRKSSFIINDGLNQFALDRNNRDAFRWELGDFSYCDWYQSNLMPLHIAGTVGIAADLLTVTDATGAPTGTLVFSGATGGVDAIKEGDLFEFQDGVTGQPDVRFLTTFGESVTTASVQFRATADATEAAGAVTVTFEDALVGPTQAPARNRNVSSDIAIGMECRVLPTHRVGLVWSADAFYLGMPALDDQEPFPTSSVIDPTTGASLRSYYGTVFGESRKRFAHDAVWGKKLFSDYAMRLIFKP